MCAHLRVDGGTEQFLLAERLTSLTGEDIDGPLLQLTFDGPEEHIQGLSDVLLEEVKGVVVGGTVLQ